jgi:hypothetical protein
MEEDRGTSQRRRKLQDEKQRLAEFSERLALLEHQINQPDADFDDNYPFESSRRNSDETAHSDTNMEDQTGDDDNSLNV